MGLFFLWPSSFHLTLETDKFSLLSIQFQKIAYAENRGGEASPHGDKTLHFYFSAFQSASNKDEGVLHLRDFFLLLQEQLKALNVLESFDFKPFIREVFNKGFRVEIIEENNIRTFRILENDSNPLSNSETQSHIQIFSETLNSLYDEALYLTRIFDLLKRPQSSFSSISSEERKRIIEMGIDYIDVALSHQNTSFLLNVRVDISLSSSITEEGGGGKSPFIVFEFHKTEWIQGFFKSFERVEALFSEEGLFSTRTAEPLQELMVGENGLEENQNLSLAGRTFSLNSLSLNERGRDAIIFMLSRARNSFLFASTQFSSAGGASTDSIKTGHAFFNKNYRIYREKVVVPYLYTDLLKGFLRVLTGQNYENWSVSNLRGEIERIDPKVSAAFLKALFQRSYQIVEEMTRVVELQERLLLDDKVTTESLLGQKRRKEIINEIFILAPSKGRLILHLLQLSPEKLAEIVWDSTERSSQNLSERYREMVSRVNRITSNLSHSFFPESVEMFSGQTEPKRENIVEAMVHLFRQMTGNELYNLLLDVNRGQGSGSSFVTRALGRVVEAQGPMRSAYLAVEIANIERNIHLAVSSSDSRALIREQEARHASGISNRLMQEASRQVGRITFPGIGEVSGSSLLFYFGITALAFAKFQFVQGDTSLYTGQLLLQSLASPEGILAFFAFMYVSSGVTNGLQFFVLKSFYSDILKFQSQSGFFPPRWGGQILRPRFFMGLQAVGLVAASLVSHFGYTFLGDPRVKRCVHEVISGSWGEDCKNAKAIFTSRAESYRFAGGTAAVVLSASATQAILSGLRFVGQSEFFRRARGLGGILRTYESVFRATTITSRQMFTRKLSWTTLSIFVFLVTLDSIYEPMTNFFVEWTYSGSLTRAKEEFQRALNLYQQRSPNSALELAISLVGLREAYKNHREQSLLYSYDAKNQMYEQIRLKYQSLVVSSREFYQRWLLNNKLTLHQNDLYGGEDLPPLIRKEVFNSDLVYSEYDFISYLLLGQVCGNKTDEIESSLEKINEEGFFASPPTFIPFRTVNEFYRGSDRRRRRVDSVCFPLYRYNSYIYPMQLQTDQVYRPTNNEAFYDDREDYYQDGIASSLTRSLRNYWWPPLNFATAQFQFLRYRAHDLDDRGELTYTPPEYGPERGSFTFPRWIKANVNQEMREGIINLSQETILRREAHIYVLNRIYASGGRHQDPLFQELRNDAEKRELLTNIVIEYLKSAQENGVSAANNMNFCYREANIEEVCRLITDFFYYSSSPSSELQEPDVKQHPLEAIVHRSGKFDDYTRETQEKIKFHTWWGEKFDEIEYQNSYKFYSVTQQIFQRNFRQEDLQASIEEEVVFYNEVLSTLRDRVIGYGYASCNQSNSQEDYPGYVNITDVKWKWTKNFKKKDLEKAQEDNGILLKKIRKYLSCIITKREEEKRWDSEDDNRHHISDDLLFRIRKVISAQLQNEEEISFNSVFGQSANGDEMTALSDSLIDKDQDYILVKLLLYGYRKNLDNDDNGILYRLFSEIHKTLEVFKFTANES